MKSLALCAILALPAVGILSSCDEATAPQLATPTASDRRKAPPSPQDPQSSRSVGTGSLEGTVRYVADPKRKWRRGRYYVDKGGRLAEAVVALRKVSSVSDSPPSPTVWTVDQKHFQFVPETVAIRAGDAVKFTNSDREIHNVRTSDGFHTFNVSIAHGSEALQTFRRAAGIDSPIRLGCAFHGSMRGWIYVFGHPFFAVTATEGRFHFVDIPAGEYSLDVVHPAGGLRWSSEVTIEDGDSAVIDVTMPPDSKIEKP